MLRLIVLFAALVAVVLAAPGYYNPYAPFARYVVPAPYAYHAAPAVYHSVEPVEQHGYSIVY